jgi:dephospho-CoA kinase
VLDIPLLFEGRESGKGSAASRNVETTVVVWVPEAVQIERQIARDRCTREEAIQRDARAAAARPQARARRSRDRQLGSLADTERQVREYAL